MLHVDINAVKADMTHIYGRPDPRSYFRELGKVDYKIPDCAKPVFDSLIHHLEDRKNEPVCALDLGCSYGVNAALLKHDLDMDDLYEHWTDPLLDHATPEQVIDADRLFFEELPTASSTTIVGLDSSMPAIDYAKNAGLLDEGLALDLERGPLPEAASGMLQPVDIIISTGCVGYVTETSFSKLMPVVTQGQKPWLANFVLRMFSFEPIAQELATHGYVTEKLDCEPFVQRAFVSHDEQEGVLDKLAAQGLDTKGEENGHLIAEFYLSRPEPDAAVSIGEIIGV